MLFGSCFVLLNLGHHISFQSKKNWTLWCHWWCPSFRASYLACTCWTRKRLR
jgi:hypothetical protein